MLKKIKKIIFKDRNKDGKVDIKDFFPKITTDSLAEHREEVLSGAKKYIYPLEHSKKTILNVSVIISLLTVLLFSITIVINIYKLQKTSEFLYKITRAVPLPVARSGYDFVSFEEYLFELRHYMYFYENKQKQSFDTNAGKDQLETYKSHALKYVIDINIARSIAEKNSITVTDADIEARIQLYKSQNRIGNTDADLEKTLKDYWNWTLSDFRRSLRNELLLQKVNLYLDNDTNLKAETVLTRIKNGEDFANIAKELSDDENTKEGGGDIGVIERTNTGFPPEMIDELFKLSAGEVSQVFPVNNGTSLAIVKARESTADRVTASVILFKLKPLDSYFNDIKDRKPYKVYINLKKIETAETTNL